MDHVGLTVNRKLITEEHAKELGNQSNLLNAIYNLEQYRWNAFIQLVKDIFNQKYYLALSEMAELKIEVYDRKLQNEKDDDKKDQYLQQKLLAQKTVLTSKKMLNSLDSLSSECLNHLYGEILLLVPSLYKDYSQNDYIIESTDIKALKLEVQKAYEEKEMWFLPYIMNPSLSFEFDYYFDESSSMLGYEAGDWTWSIGISGSLDVMDRGENDLEALNRKSNHEIKQLELEDSLDKKEKELEQYAMDIEISNIDLTLKQLEMGNAIDDAQEAVELYKNGYITVEDKELELMKRDQAKLDYLQVLHQLYTTELELMKESGIILGGYAHEEEK
jgi:hypothetical protein